MAGAPGQLLDVEVPVPGKLPHRLRRVREERGSGAQQPLVPRERALVVAHRKPREEVVSSHLMSEMAQTATRLVVLGRGQLISETSVEDFTGQAAASGVLVRTPETARLRQVLAAPGVTVIDDGTDLLRVSGTTAEQIGTAAWRCGRR